MYEGSNVSASLPLSVILVIVILVCVKSHSIMVLIWAKKKLCKNITELFWPAEMPPPQRHSRIFSSLILNSLSLPLDFHHSLMSSSALGTTINVSDLKRDYVCPAQQTPVSGISSSKSECVIYCTLVIILSQMNSNTVNFQLSRLLSVLSWVKLSYRKPNKFLEQNYLCSVHNCIVYTYLCTPYWRFLFICSQ